MGRGVSGTSEQFGMWPRCDPTVRTARSHKRGQGIGFRLPQLKR